MAGAGFGSARLAAMARRIGTIPRFGAAAVAATWLAALWASAQPAGKPPVPPGEPTAGPAVVMLTTGIDYTRPSVARKLARDGEGELAGWDAVDRDRRPYGTDPMQSRLVEIAPGRVIPIRVDPANAASVTEATAFVRKTGSRVLIVPIALFGVSQPAELSKIINDADLLVIAAGADDGRPHDLPADARDRIIVVGALSSEGASVAANAASVDVVLLPPAAAREAPGDGRRAPRNAPEAAILFSAQLACRKSELAAAKDARDAKRILLVAARPERGGLPPVLEDCTRTLAPR